MPNEDLSDTHFTRESDERPRRITIPLQDLNTCPNFASYCEIVLESDFVFWRQAGLAFVCGSTLSIIVAIFLETTLPYLAYLLLEPAWDLAEGIADIGWGAPGLIPKSVRLMVKVERSTSRLARPAESMDSRLGTKAK